MDGHHGIRSFRAGRRASSAYPMNRAKPACPKHISLSEIDAVVARHGRATAADHAAALAAGDNRTLFQQFLAAQWELLRTIVTLRFPFGAYVRDEIAAAIADRECATDASEGALDLEARHAAAKRRVHDQALALRHAPGFVAGHGVADRFRTARLRYIHAAAVRAGDLYEQLEQAAAAGDAAALARAEAEATVWIANSLSCGALLQMVNVAQAAGVPPAARPEDAARQQSLAAEMLRRSRRVEAFRNELVKLNLGIARRHADLAPSLLDANSRLSFAQQGLLEAVDRYSPTLPAPFEGFAPIWVSQAVKRGLQQSAGLIAIPINVQKNAAQVRQYVAAQVENGRPRHVITRQELRQHVRDAAGGRPLSAAALGKALAAPVVDSLDAPPVETDTRDAGQSDQFAADEPDPATQQIQSERDRLLEALVYDNTTAAERVLLSLSVEWGNMIELTKEFLDDLIRSSEHSTRDRLEGRRCPVPAGTHLVA